jgi:hypothetical protein
VSVSVNPAFLKGTQRSEVALFGIGNDGGDARVGKDDLREDLADGSQPNPRPVIAGSPMARSIPAEVSSALNCPACRG